MDAGILDGQFIAEIKKLSGEQLEQIVKIRFLRLSQFECVCRSEFNVVSPTLRCVS
jgi:hypothetical protein